MRRSTPTAEATPMTMLRLSSIQERIWPPAVEPRQTPCSSDVSTDYIDGKRG